MRVSDIVNSVVLGKGLFVCRGRTVSGFMYIICVYIYRERGTDNCLMNTTSLKAQ